MYQQSGWDLGVFGSEDQLPVEVLPAPRQVETAINAVMAGSRLITPIGGGVAIQARKALSDENVKRDESGAISQTKSAAAVEELADGSWWWD
jgi:hypothetical protein